MASDSSKTAQKQRKNPPGKPFVKGDPRINRKGRPPVNSEELNALLDEIFAEEVQDDRGNKMGKLRVALNKMLLGKNIAGAIHLLERRYGKVPDKHEIGGKDGDPLKVIIEYARSENNPPAAPPSATEDKE